MKALMLSGVCLSLIAVSAWAGEKCCDPPDPAGGDKAGVAVCPLEGKTMECAIKEGGKCKGAAQKTMTCEGGKCEVAPREGVKATLESEGTISADGLAALIRAKVPVLIFDARSGKYDDGRRIPGAKSLNAASTPDEVKAAIPDKTALIITYCGGVKCPASHLLAERLRKDGFENIVEFPEGIEGWIKAGHESEKVKR